MNNELVTYIRKQLQSGGAIQDILAELKKQGHSDSDVNTAFREATQPAAKTPGADLPDEVPSSKKAKASVLDVHHIDAGKAFVFIGTLLIISALIIVMASQWSSVGPLTRIAFVAVPMFVLFGIANALKDKADSEEIYLGTLATAAFMFPFAVGTTLYQLKIIPEINALLLLVSSLLSYLLNAYIEFIGRKPKFALLSLMSLYAFVAAVLMQFELGYLVTYWILTLVTVGIALVGYYLLKQKSDSAPTYFTVGVILSSFMIPGVVLATLNDISPLSFEISTLVTAVFGLMHLGIAMYLHNTYKELPNAAVMTVKRLLEELAPFWIIGPFLVAGFENAFFMLIGLALSFGAIFASIRVKIRTLLPVGTLGVVVGLLYITGKYFINSLGWPVVIFLCGFAMIGISYMVRNIREKTNTGDDGTFYGLGEEKPAPGQDPKHHLSGSRLLVILVLLIFIIPMLFGLISSLAYDLFGRSRTEPRVYDVPPPVYTTPVSKSNAPAVTLTVNGVSENLTLDYDEAFTLAWDGSSYTSCTPYGSELPYKDGSQSWPPLSAIDITGNALLLARSGNSTVASTLNIGITCQSDKYGPTSVYRTITVRPK